MVMIRGMRIAGRMMDEFVADFRLEKCLLAGSDSMATMAKVVLLA